MFSELNSMLNEVLNDYNKALDDINKALDDIVKLKKDIDWYKKYTDKLVEHKDMVCLPADLKNLRESNAALATENQELKKQVEAAKSVIIQTWFTDIQDKDKQIEHLLQKVKELSDPELKDDEDVTKTFMDAQANPKDIEFDGDKLVASVEEAASKLKSIKEHNNRFTKEISFSTGIACPKCGSELMYVDQNLLLSNPPKRRVQCSKCNHIDYILV